MAALHSIFSSLAILGSLLENLLWTLGLHESHYSLPWRLLLFPTTTLVSLKWCNSSVQTNVWWSIQTHWTESVKSNWMGPAKQAWLKQCVLCEKETKRKNIYILMYFVFIHIWEYDTCVTAFFFSFFFSVKASPLLSVTLGPKIKGHLALDSTLFCLFARLRFKISASPLENKTKQKQRNILEFSLLHSVKCSQYLNF